MMRSVLVFTLLLMAGCGAQGPGGGDQPADGKELTGRTFLSTSVTGYQLAANTRIILAFPEHGKITATGGCNHLFGEVNFDTDKLAVSNMGGTDMACGKPLMDQDDWVTKFLTAKPVWALTGDELVLTGADAEIKLVDRKTADPDRPLTGRRWIVDSLLDGEASRSVPQGAQAYLEFQGDKVTGNTGCNTLSGNFSQKDGTITFSNIATTKIACPGDLGALERAVLDVVEGEVTVRIDADRLTLVHVTGQGLHLRSNT